MGMLCPLTLGPTAPDMPHSSQYLVHPNGAQSVASQMQSTVHGDAGGKTSSTNGASTPNSIKSDGNVLFECTVCKRPVGS